MLAKSSPLLMLKSKRTMTETAILRPKTMTEVTCIELERGQQITLRKEGGKGLKQLLCGLGWDVAENRGLLKLFKPDFDLDSAVLCLDENNNLKDGDDVLYYGNLKHPSGAISHLGDNMTGEGEGDSEQILVKFPKVPPEIAKLVFVVTIYDCYHRRQDFGQVQNAYVRLEDAEDDVEMARYELSGEEYDGKTGMILAEVFRQGNGWQLVAVGEGLKVGSLQELVEIYTSRS